MKDQYFLFLLASSDSLEEEEFSLLDELEEEELSTLSTSFFEPSYLIYSVGLFWI